MSKGVILKCIQHQLYQSLQGKKIKLVQIYLQNSQIQSKNLRTNERIQLIFQKRKLSLVSTPSIIYKQNQMKNPQFPVKVKQKIIHDSNASQGTKIAAKSQSLCRKPKREPGKIYRNKSLIFKRYQQVDKNQIAQKMGMFDLVQNKKPIQKIIPKSNLLKINNKTINNKIIGSIQQIREQSIIKNKCHQMIDQCQQNSKIIQKINNCQKLTHNMSQQIVKLRKNIRTSLEKSTNNYANIIKLQTYKKINQNQISEFIYQTPKKSLFIQDKPTPSTKND